MVNIPVLDSVFLRWMPTLPDSFFQGELEAAALIQIVLRYRSKLSELSTKSMKMENQLPNMLFSVDLPALNGMSINDTINSWS